jgi:hypothetical protein
MNLYFVVFSDKRAEKYVLLSLKDIA